MIQWTIQTLTGSLYEVQKSKDQLRLIVHTPPSSPDSEDLRGKILPIAVPDPWPPRVGQPILLCIFMPGKVKYRLTSQVVRISEPVVLAES